MGADIRFFFPTVATPDSKQNMCRVGRHQEIKMLSRQSKTEPIKATTKI